MSTSESNERKEKISIEDEKKALRKIIQEEEERQFNLEKEMRTISEMYSCCGKEDKSIKRLLEEKESIYRKIKNDYKDLQFTIADNMKKRDKKEEENEKTSQ